MVIREEIHDDNTHGRKYDKHENVCLGKLPGEVRNAIYEYLISRGDLSLMRTNHLIYQEMRGLVLRSIPYRLYVNYPEEARYPRRLPSGWIGEGIRNVEIHWRGHPEIGWRQRDMEKKEWDDGPGASFGLGSEVRRPWKCCVVYFESVPDLWITWIREQDLDALASLRVFDSVVFRVLLGSRAIVGLEVGPLCGIEVGVQWALGAAVERALDSEGAFAEFRPREKATEFRCPENWRLMNREPDSWSEQEKAMIGVADEKWWNMVDVYFNMM